MDPYSLAFVGLMALGTFFSPCAVALLPAYVAYFTGLGPQASTMRPLRSGLRFGAAAAFGLVSVYAVAGALILFLRTQLDLSSQVLGATLSILAILIGIALVVFGALLLAGRDLAVTVPVHAPESKGVVGIAGFGALYALASLGCSLPLAFNALFQALRAPVAEGILLFLVFSGTVGLLMFVSGVALALWREAATRWLRAALPRIRIAMGLVLIASGGYVLYYYLVKAPPF